STSVATSKPDGRSTAIRSVLGSATAPRRAQRPLSPASVCFATNRASTLPRPSSTHTACSSCAQSIPTKYSMVTLLVRELRSVPPGDLAGRSLNGAQGRSGPRRDTLLPVGSPGLSVGAGLMRAVERRATQALHGEAPGER